MQNYMTVFICISMEMNAVNTYIHNYLFSSE